VTEAVPSTDEASVSPDAGATDEPTAQTRSPRTWPWFVSIVVAVALVVGLVWAAGGFEYRDDLEMRVDPGVTFATGPYVFTFAAATIQRTKNYKDEQIWTLVVAGTGQTTAEESMSPDYDDLFVAKDIPSGAYREAEGQQFGAEESRGTSGGAHFTPGLAKIPYRVTFEFPVSDFDPGTSILFVTWELEWRDTSLLQVGDLRWAPTNHYYRLELPLRRLADDLD
jgi:hypothetical protein